MMTSTIAPPRRKESAKPQQETILARALQTSPEQSQTALKHFDALFAGPEFSSNMARQDISERDSLLCTKSDSESLENILQLLPCGVILLSGRGVVVDCNQAAEELLGTKIKNKAWRDIIADRFNPRLDDGHEISLKNGKRISLLTRSQGKKPGQIIVLNDLTETRELQEQLSRHQRLSAMGKTISSLAHQIRTPLTAALLYADKLSSSTASDYSTARYSGKILSRLQNIERQIKDMLIFTRGKTELPQVISIEELVFNLKEAVCDIPDDAASRLDWRIAEGAGYIDCNLDALTGAVINLVENAVHASESHQSIEIALAIKNFHGPCLEIAVIDNGHGIAEELLVKLEEPFVTTKSQGTGLGLAIVKLVTEAHRGQFELTSRKNRGVSALMRLPLSKQEAVYE